MFVDVEKRFVGGLRRSCADSSPVRTRRRGEPAGDGEDGFGSGGSAMLVVVVLEKEFGDFGAGSGCALQGAGGTMTR